MELDDALGQCDLDVDTVDHRQRTRRVSKLLSDDRQRSSASNRATHRLELSIQINSAGTETAGPENAGLKMHFPVLHFQWILNNQHRLRVNSTQTVGR